MPGPISPENVENLKLESIPDAVYDVFNELILENWDGTSSTVMQETVVLCIADRLGILREEVFSRKLLNIEGAYRKKGWSVTYDKPDYNESYKAYYEFTKRSGF